MLGPYELLAELARGGQGVVYKARQPGIDRTLAIKVLLTPTPNHLERFKQEAQVLARLQHPNLPKVMDLGEDSGRPYMVMEFLEGTDLGDVIREQGPLDADAAVEILATIARTLQHCHEHGVVHRDLKPGNVMIKVGTGSPVLVDFGLLKRDPQTFGELSTDQRASLLTQTGETLGTPSYMAPEQTDPSFGAIGPHTDVYALGATLYCLLTGEAPFKGATSYNVILKVMQELPPDPRRIRPEVPSHLADLCMRAMAKEVGERPASAERFAGELSGLARPRPRSLISPRILTVATVALGVLGFGLWKLSSPAPIGGEELRARAKAIHSEAGEWLRAKGPIRSATAPVSALSQRLQLLAARAAPGERDALRRADARVAALVGLSALANGDPQSARASLEALKGDVTPEALALRGGLLSLPGGDGPDAARLLARAMRRRVNRIDLRAWRARAHSRSQALGTTAAAEILEDLERVEVNRGQLSPEERAIRIRALLTRGHFPQAEAELHALSDPPVDLAWEFALVRVDAELGTNPQACLDRLASLSPQDVGGGSPKRAALAKRVANLVLETLAQVDLTQSAEEEESAARNRRILALERQTIPAMRLHRALLPNAPLPPEIRAAVLAKGTGYQHRGPLDMALALADLEQDDLVVQRTVAYQIQRSQPRESLIPLFEVMRRAIRLEPDATERTSLRSLLCSQIARVMDDLLRRYDDQLGPESLDLASQLLEQPLEANRRAAILVARSRVLRLKGDYEDSLRDLDESLALRGDVPFNHGLRGLTYELLGRHEEALKDFVVHHHNSVDRGPIRERAGLRVWEASRKVKGYDDQVLRSIDIVLRGGESRGGWLVRAAWLHLKAGDVDEAKSRLAKARPIFQRETDLRSLEQRLASLIAAVEERGRAALDAASALVEELERLRMANPGRMRP